MSEHQGKLSDSVHTTRRGRPVGDHASKRSELLKAIVELLADDGCNGVSFRKVASKVGCTTGTMTYYFESKEAMLLAVADYFFDEFEKILNDNQGNISHILKCWLTWSLSESSTVAPVMAEFLIYARQEPNFAQYLQKKYSLLKSILAATLKKSQNLGLVRDDIDATLLAEQLNALVDGWMLLSSIEPERFKSQQTQIFFDTTLKIISPNSYQNKST